MLNVIPWREPPQALEGCQPKLYARPSASAAVRSHGPPVDPEGRAAPGTPGGERAGDHRAPPLRLPVVRGPKEHPSGHDPRGVLPPRCRLLLRRPVHGARGDARDPDLRPRAAPPSPSEGERAGDPSLRLLRDLRVLVDPGPFPRAGVRPDQPGAGQLPDGVRDRLAPRAAAAAREEAEPHGRRVPARERGRGHRPHRVHVRGPPRGLVPILSPDHGERARVDRRVLLRLPREPVGSWEDGGPPVDRRRSSGGGAGVPRPGLVPPVEEVPDDPEVPPVLRCRLEAARGDPRARGLLVPREDPGTGVLHPLGLGGRARPRRLCSSGAPPGTMGAMRRHMAETKFVRWTVKGSQVPPSWRTSDRDGARRLALLTVT